MGMFIASTARKDVLYPLDTGIIRPKFKADTKTSILISPHPPCQTILTLTQIRSPLTQNVAKWRVFR